MNITSKQLVEYVSLIRTLLDKRHEEVNDKLTLDVIESFILESPEIGNISFKERQTLVDKLFNAIRRELDILQPYLEDETITEIMVNGPNSIFIEKKGIIEKVPESFESKGYLEKVIRRVVSKVNREINDLNPIVDARLEDGSRVNAVYSNIAENGPILTIRKFPKNKLTIENLIENKTITKEAADFLKKLVEGGYNLFVSGGTSSGKTTLLNVLSDFIPKNQRVIVMEDAMELQITKLKNVLRLETKNKNTQGKGEVTMSQLIKTSLRMRPDRIVVGEVRGKEALDMIQAMNTGHDGSFSTGHANSPEGMITRLETMLLMAENFPIEAIRNQIVAALDVIVHISKVNHQERKVTAIVEVLGNKKGQIQLNPLFEFKEGHHLRPTGNRMEKSWKVWQPTLEA